MGAGGRSRKSSSADPAMTLGLVGPSSAPGGGGSGGGGEEPHHSLIHSGTSSMTYFLADEAMVNAPTASSPGGSGTFGVRSLSTSLQDPDTSRRRKGSFVSTVSAEYLQQSRDGGGDEREEEEGDDDRALDERSVASFQSSIHPSSDSIRRPPQELLSQPLTPILGPSPDPQGTPLRSPSGISCRSEEDGMGEPAESEEASRNIFMEKLDVLVAPQLIMPEITIPSRRPFTTKGKNIGRLKVLIAGDSGMSSFSTIIITACVFTDSLGIGKTSLIKSIVQASEDIVHVDPISTSGSLSGSRSSSYFAMNNRASGDSTKKITEVYASTRPYPHWWSELDDSKLLRRRKSKYGTEEQIIERNLCFVDTPGYGSGTSVCSCY